MTLVKVIWHKATFDDGVIFTNNSKRRAVCLLPIGGKEATVLYAGPLVYPYSQVIEAFTYRLARASVYETPCTYLDEPSPIAVRSTNSPW